jgi:hypothetical protein
VVFIGGRWVGQRRLRAGSVVSVFGAVSARIGLVNLFQPFQCLSSVPRSGCPVKRVIFGCGMEWRFERGEMGVEKQMHRSLGRCDLARKYPGFGP